MLARRLLRGVGMVAAPGAARSWIRPASVSMGASTSRGIAASRPTWADAAPGGAAVEGGANATAEGKKDRAPRKPRSRYPRPGPNPCPARVIAAQVVERLPALTPLPEQWELDYHDLKSRKDDAVRKPMPVEFYRKLGMEHVEDQGPEKEEEEMTFASRTTEADEANDTKSLRRALDRRLYLIVKGKDGKWTFPNSLRQEGETMRDAARRSLREYVGPELNATQVGFCPMAHSDAGEGDAKERTFYYYSQYHEGELVLQEPLVVDYMWALREEVRELLPAELYPMMDEIIDK